MGFSGAMLALSAVKGIASIGSSYAQAGEDKYNASLFDQQAKLLQVQGDITQGQYRTQAGQLLSDQTAMVAAKGLDPGGSSAAVMLNSQTQIETDMAIARFNTEMGVNRAGSEATNLRDKAKQSIYSGYSSAFTDLLSGAAQYGQYKNKINTN